jgi:tRNA1Val (adenine37-N6)-methyltransferase
MSSINAYYTIAYSQPPEYRFSHDSVFLAREVFEREREHLCSGMQVLDLCSGCGVVGLDFLFHVRAGLGFELDCDFLEIQEVYRPHFEENVRRFQGGAGPERMSINSNSSLRFLGSSYESVEQGRYDLIVANPPYFEPGIGKMSPSEFKNRCRFFLDAPSSELWRSIERALKPGGRAYVLARDLGEHGRDLVGEIRAAVSPSVRAGLAGRIRSTPLVLV